jgi:hypothetical protein
MEEIRMVLFRDSEDVKQLIAASSISDKETASTNSFPFPFPYRPYVDILIASPAVFLVQTNSFRGMVTRDADFPSSIGIKRAARFRLNRQSPGWVIRSSFRYQQASTRFRFLLRLHFQAAGTLDCIIALC